MNIVVITTLCLALYVQAKPTTEQPMCDRINCPPDTDECAIAYESIATNRACVQVTVAITIALALLGTVNAEECGQEEFTKCAEPLEMLHMSSEFSIGAAKKEELDKLCHELRKGLRCIQSYTRRCMDLQQRNQFNKLYHGTNQFIRDLCNKGEFQDEYLKHAPCSEVAKKEFELCANRYKETMVFLKPNKNQEIHIHENLTLSENIKTICCSINELGDCSENAARKLCDADAAKFTRQLVDKYANSLTKIYCEDFSRDTDICRSGEDDAGIPLRSRWQLVINLTVAMFAWVSYQRTLLTS